MLATLTTGSRIPWKLDRNGTPMWLTVVSVDAPGRYTVQYPDGHLETLTDSE